jgi:hypothetical protein
MISIEGTPSGGTFSLSEGSRTTGPIPYNAPAGWPRDPANRSIPDLDDRFQHHSPTSNARRRAHEMVRDECLRLAKAIDELMPHCREKSTAMTNLEQVMFWANAGIARQPNGEGQ